VVVILTAAAGANTASVFTSALESVTAEPPAITSRLSAATGKPLSVMVPLPPRVLPASSPPLPVDADAAHRLHQNETVRRDPVRGAHGPHAQGP